MKDFAEKFYTGKQWQACRASFIAERVKIDGGLCQHCREQLGYIVHHTIELNAVNINDPFTALNHELLEYVCLDCHNKEHGVFRPAQPQVIFDDDGDVVGLWERRPPHS